MACAGSHPVPRPFCSGGNQPKYRCRQHGDGAPVTSSQRPGIGVANGLTVLVRRPHNPGSFPLFTAGIQEDRHAQTGTRALGNDRRGPGHGTGLRGVPGEDPHRDLGFREQLARAAGGSRSDLGPAARNQIDTAFSENPKLSAKFSVIEREKLGMVMKEQGLGDRRRGRPADRGKVGKILGVKYIVTGGIDKFSINTTRGGIARRRRQHDDGRRRHQPAVHRHDDRRTGDLDRGGRPGEEGRRLRPRRQPQPRRRVGHRQRGGAEGVEGDRRQARDRPLPRQGLERGGRAARASTCASSRSMARAPTSTSARPRASKSATSSASSTRGEELVDPATGAKLGAEEKQTGTGVVTEVKEKFSIMTLTGTAKNGDVLKR